MSPRLPFPPGGSRVPIKNTGAEHSFVVSLIYLEDSGPVCDWSKDAKALFGVLMYLGAKQRDKLATTGDENDHYQRQKDKLLKEALDWLKLRPGVKMLDDYLWTFSLTNKHRIWGILTDNVFYLLWNDPEHKIYPYDIQDNSKGKKR